MANLEVAFDAIREHLATFPEDTRKSLLGVVNHIITAAEQKSTEITALKDSPHMAGFAGIMAPHLMAIGMDVATGAFDTSGAMGHFKALLVENGISVD